MNFMNGSIRLGRFLGITIRVHMLFLIWVGFQLYQSGRDWQIELFYAAMYFVIILVHEFGHCLGARSVGGFAEDILMWPLGGLAFASAPMRPWPQFVTVVCGPLVNVIFCLASATYLVIAAKSFRAVPLNPFSGGYYPVDFFTTVGTFFQVNYVLLLFNMLPIYPFDGGQMFCTLIWPWLGLNRATQVACQLGLAGAAVLGGLGLMRGSPILCGIALFGGSTCWQRLQMAKHGMIMDERFSTYDHIRRQRGEGRVVSWWQRLFRRRPSETRGGAQNPNPGGWEAKLSQEDRLESEVDRILQKVHERGINSLSYVERQTLERATRMRREREEEIDRRNRV